MKLSSLKFTYRHGNQKHNHTTSKQIM